jgi:hypothetical protein
MDARQNFYNHNRLLFRFLVLATLVFVGIVGLVSWQEAHRVRPVSETISSLRHFSTEAAVAESTRNYAYDAKHIHDLEAYGDLVEVFFAPTLHTELGETTLEKRLSEVAEAVVDGTQFGREHVYHTSYYVGNLLVLPQLSLHELLTTAALPNTAILLETALADLRAGAVKIQNHYDVAPPTWYKGAASTSPLFYPTPSFPSLTMSEAALVFYILATVDQNQARVYEHQAKVFASQVFTSGAHFWLDVEYAILLANEYIKIMQDLPPYQELFSKAAAEWSTDKVTRGEVGLENIPYDFTFPEFPVRSEFSLDVVGDITDLTAERPEELLGTLRLTLVDNRLPQPTLKLYTYDIAGQGQVLPFALDLTARQFPGLMSSVGFAQFLDTDNYLFLSGVATADSKAGYDLASTSVYWRNSKVTPVILEPVPQESYGVSDVVLRNSGEEFLFVPIRFASNKSVIMRAELDSLYTAKVTEVAKGSSADYVGENNIVYLRDGQVYYADLKTGKESVLEGLSDTTLSSGSFTDLKYHPEHKVLVLTTNKYSAGQEVWKSTVFIYSIAEIDGGLMAKEEMVVTLTDAKASSVLLSPGGNYLAIALTKGWGDRQGAVLLYDIKNGIISKEIDLSPFAPAPIELDGWTLF